MYKFLVFLVLFLSSPANAGALENETGSFLSYFIVLIYSVAFMGGAYFILTIIGNLCDFDKFKQRSDSPIRQLFVRGLIAGILMNPSNIIGMVSNSLGYDLNGDASYCFAFSETLQTASSAKVDNGSGLNWKYKSHEGCFTSATNSYVKKLTDKINQSEHKKITDLLVGKFRIIVGIFQTIAIYFFFSAWFKIAQISEGKERQTTYGKQIIIIIVSCVFINLPSTIQALEHEYDSVSAEEQAASQVR
ncbi:hypothetical protein [Photobacterium kishitanii]|uniref:Uncharacterized protein n=1 Tax=Photobacterium kishitanii TaxID=318456 RepID=A0A2T3KAW7_9GAMM|nr:hypothetical protein [Photobacterium kishitanii]PSU89766.1 hypothetical protein C9J27_24095 [Photobacterium kishitanii]